jgi:hypothetical protein
MRPQISFVHSHTKLGVHRICGGQLSLQSEAAVNIQTQEVLSVIHVTLLCSACNLKAVLRGVPGAKDQREAVAL